MANPVLYVAHPVLYGNPRCLLWRGDREGPTKARGISPRFAHSVFQRWYRVCVGVRVGPLEQVSEEITSKQSTFFSSRDGRMIAS